MIINLNRTLGTLPPEVAAPRYDLRAVSPAIVHIGLGGFHRAHFARYTHDLMNSDPTALSWGIVGAGLRRSDSDLLTALHRQQGLYTLVERDHEGETKTLIGSLIDTIDASQSSDALLAAIDRPATRIVSITVSEHGYHLAGATRTLNLNDAAILDDIAHHNAPRTMPGILVEGLRRRKQSGRPAFTAMSCDNIQHNGRVLRDAVLALAAASDTTLAEWIATHGCFPSSMVDRITPVPLPEQIEAFNDATRVADEAPVFAETFRQWVIEDRFADGRPDWDRVGAQFVDDVTPYETMKLRLLNASHLAIAGLGVLCGYETVIDTIGDPLIRRYMVRLMDAETGPTVPPVPGIDLTAYKSSLLDRFANPAIRDTVRRINADAPVNLLLDPLRDRLAADASIDLLALGLAAWCKRAVVEASLPVEGRLMGRAEARLQQQARIATDDPAAFLAIDEIFGAVGRDTRLLSAIDHWLQSFGDYGVGGTLSHAAAEGLF